MLSRTLPPESSEKVFGENEKKIKIQSDDPHRADRNLLHSVIYVAMKNEISQHFISLRKEIFEIVRRFRVEPNPKIGQKCAQKTGNGHVTWSFNSLRT